MPPRPPHKEPRPPGPREPPRLQGRASRAKALLISVAAGCIVTCVFVLAMMWLVVSANVIIPAAAPIFIGTITLAFLAQQRHP